jgi:hypothetical protein
MTQQEEKIQELERRIKVLENHTICIQLIELMITNKAANPDR